MTEPSALSSNLRNLHADLQRSMMEHFERDVPFEELLFDRWERASVSVSAKGRASTTTRTSCSTFGLARTPGSGRS